MLAPPQGEGMPPADRVPSGGTYGGGGVSGLDALPGREQGTESPERGQQDGGRTIEQQQQQGRRAMLLPELPRQAPLQNGWGGQQETSPSPSSLRPMPSRQPSFSGPAPNLPPPESFYGAAASSSPSLAAALAPPVPSASTSRAPSPARPAQLQQRASFVGIPGGRLHPPPSPLPHPSPSPGLSSAHDRTPSIPSFSPAAAFSAQDRGPYPPMGSGGLSSSRGPSAAPAGDESELLAPALDARPLSNQSLSAFSPFGADAGRPGSLAFDFASLPEGDMAGIGRNSILRASASASSPTAAGAQQQAQQQAQRSSPPRPGQQGGPKSPQLVGPSLQALQAGSAAQIASSSPPSVAAPLAPPPGGYSIAPSGPAGAAQPAPPPHLVPQPEVCVECMMRDRDMADVDVTGEGVWERESDVEWREQERWEAENPTGAGEGSWNGEHSGSQESGARGRKASSSGHAGPGQGGRKRLGKGQALTQGNLKVLTTMNPPAAAHRWRTLQTFLATQLHLIELERQAREAAASAERDREQQRSFDARSSISPSVASRNRSSSLLSPASLAAEKAQLEHEERHARARERDRGKNRSRSTLADETNRYSSASLFPPSAQASSPIPISAPQPPFAPSASAASIRSYTAGDQPWLGNQLRRFSSPGLNDNSPPKSPAASTSSPRFTFGKFARSTTDLRTAGTPRSVSPARSGPALSMMMPDGASAYDGRRTSMWSRFRQSASASVLSFAPSGSMMDMHLWDPHEAREMQHAPYQTYPSMSDPQVARHIEHLERDRAIAAATAAEAGGKKKKKGIKGFFNKLVGGGKKDGHGASASAPATPGETAPYGAAPFAADDDELAPPPPLSALANEPRYHQRSASNSSVDSLGPYTPPALHPANFRSSYTMPMPDPAAAGAGAYRGAADRQSILTVGSFQSQRSKNGGSLSLGATNGGSGDRRATVLSQRSFGRPSLDSLRTGSEPPPVSARLGSPEPAVHVVESQGEPEVLLGVGGDSLPSPLDGGAYPQPRLQKSLPSLPTEAMYHPSQAYSAAAPSFPPHEGSPYQYYAGSRSAYSLAPDDFGPSSGMNGSGDGRKSATLGSSVGGGGRPRSRSKVVSMNLASFFGGGKKAKAAQGGVPPVPTASLAQLRGASLDSAVALDASTPYAAREAPQFR
ncbi:hypothetical protein JCM10213_005819 [Rhodosporidiobolus nylandii]